MKRYPLITLFIVLCFAILQVRAQDNTLLTISGTVKDFKSHREVEYVNVTAVGTNAATVTNMDGVFTLKVRNARLIEFSRIGYETLKVPVEPFKPNVTLYIRPKTVMLGEVVVTPVDAEKIVAHAIEHIERNYSKQPSLFTSFYRETIQKKKRYINITEAITQIYKSAYNQPFGTDRVRIYKGRKVVSPDMRDTLAVKLAGGPTLANDLDMVKTPDDFLNKTDRSNYRYSFVDYVTIDGRNHYAIRFEPARIMEYPLCEGILYIDQQDLTISRMEFKLDVSDPLKVTPLILKRKPNGLIFKPLNLSYLVDYRRQSDCSYINYVRADVRFRCDWHKRLFHTNYTVVSEMVMTDRENNPEKRISFHDSFKDNQVLSEKVGDFYDADFWGDYNIIEPTESLEHAVQKLKKNIDKMQQ